MGKILTITIPSYNVEKFLKQTLESFVDEEILEEIEVLIVDDGSQDKTAEIGLEFEKRYPKSFRVISKKNGGHGSTINRGIEECQGKYFKVVDGDDWVNITDFVQLVKKLKECDSDYVVTNYCEVNDQTGEVSAINFEQLREISKKYTDKETKGNIPFREIAEKVQLPMHALVIKSDILQKQHIRLDEHCFYVDVEYTLYPIPYVNTVTYFDLHVYMYRLAQATQSVSMQGYQKHIQNHIDVIMHLSEFAEVYARWKNHDTEKVSYINRRIAQMVGEQVTIFMSYSVNNKEIKHKFMEFERELKEKNPKVFRLSGGESGILRLLRMTNFIGYKLIMRMGQKRNFLGGDQL